MTPKVRRILVAPDSFKGTLKAAQAASAMARGVLRILPGAEVIPVPMADGGEGTAETLAEATSGQLLRSPAPDPFGGIRIASFARLGDGVTFAVDAASASGLQLLGVDERDAVTASSAGTGVLVVRAVQMGARKCILGVGGTAFVDGGVGMMEVFGARFLDSEGNGLMPGGGGLFRLDRIDLAEMPPFFREVEWEIAADVDNPLLGERGAARVYGPQKGASDDDVDRLETGLSRLADRVESMAGLALRDLPGMGAGGGLALMPTAFFGAKVRPGAELIAEAVRLEEKLQGCDLAIVGEGCLDGQSLFGKAPIHVAQMAKARSIPVLAVAGMLGPEVEKTTEAGVTRYLAVSPEEVPFEPDKAARLVEDGTARLLEEFLVRA
jgi:glycerate kinase